MVDSGNDGSAAPAAAEYNEIGAHYEPFSFTILHGTLASLCDQAARVVPSTDFQPVLKGFKVEVSQGAIRLAATDLDLAVVAASQAVTVPEPGEHSVVLPARRMLDILATIDSGSVTIAVSGDRADISAGTATWSLRLPDGTDYPAIPDITELDSQMVEVSRAKLLDALTLVRHAAGREGGRPALQQVVIGKAPDGEYRLTACDSARFAQVPVDFPFAAAIPRGALEELIRLLAANESHESIRVVTLHDGQLAFQLGGTVFTTQPAPAKFPDVEKLLLRPALENNDELRVSRTGMETAIRQVRVTADTDTFAIALQLDGAACEVVSRDKAGNRASQVLDAKWDGDKRTVVVSHRHLSELLGAMRDETAVFRLGTDTAKRKSPVLATDAATGLTGVVSQMLGSMLGYGD